jgi:uncharacterized protein (TIGR01732 family)
MGRGVKAGNRGGSGGFALIVVLFILLIIVGVSYAGGGDPVVIGLFPYPFFPVFFW